MSKTYKLEGLKAAQKAFNDRLKNVKEYTAESLIDVVLDLTGRAVEKAPVDTGDLRGSGFAEINGTEVAKGKEDGSIESKKPNIKGDKLEGVIGFTSVYAVRQHEEMGYNHPQGGQAKYLEEPYNKNQGKYIKHLSDSIKKAVD